MTRGNSAVAENTGTDIEAVDLDSAIGYSEVPETFADAIGGMDLGGDIIEFKGSPWTVLKDKSELVGKPFVIADVRKYDGDFGEAVAVCVITQDDAHWVFNDGSTGIKDQVLAFVAKTGQRAGIYCEKGLRVSNYEYTDAFGETKPAKTFYLA